MVESVMPFMLSFHGNSHYNCIVPTTWTSAGAILGDLEPGKIEEEAIQWAEKDKEVANQDDAQNNGSNIDGVAGSQGQPSPCKFEEAKVSEAQDINLGAKFQADPKKIREMLKQSR